MSSYHTSFDYLNKNSLSDYNLEIVHFDNYDNGVIDSYLALEPVYFNSYRGTKRILYNTKYTDVALLDITVINVDRSEFNTKQVREINKWLTGHQAYSWMNLYVDDIEKTKLHCYVKDVKPYKMDSRIIGFIITVESSSPWCYSPMVEKTVILNGEKGLTINCDTDDVNNNIPLKITFVTNEYDEKDIQQYGTLTIVNKTLNNEKTILTNLNQNEKITMSDNMIISDISPYISGDNFNYIWPRLTNGKNELVILGYGKLTIEYIAPMKIGECIVDIFEEENPNPPEDFVYIIEDNQVTIISYVGQSEKCIVPDTIENLPVTKISAVAFTCRDDVEVIKFLDGITTIE